MDNYFCFACGSRLVVSRSIEQGRAMRLVRPCERCRASAYSRGYEFAHYEFQSNKARTEQEQDEQEQYDGQNEA